MTATAPAAPVDLYTFTACYGRAWKQGLLVENVEAFVAAGGTVRPAASGSGRAWAIIGRDVFPVVCGDFIEVATEDGPISGRCGLPALSEHGACEAHGEEMAAWAAATEPERIAWERARA